MTIRLRIRLNDVGSFESRRGGIGRREGVRCLSSGERVVSSRVAGSVEAVNERVIVDTRWIVWRAVKDLTSNKLFLPGFVVSGSENASACFRYNTSYCMKQVVYKF